MTIRTSRFGFGFDPSVAQRETAQIPMPPARGFHGGRRYTDLEPGFTPETKNFDIRQTSVQPRSGLSQFAGGATGLGSEVLGGLEAFDEAGNFYAVAASNRTFALLESQGISWRTLDDVDQPSGTSADFWNSTVIYDDDRTSNIAVFTNNKDLPKFVDLSVGQNSVSSFTNVASFISKSRAVQAFDNRLVWLNVEENDTRRVSRVAWSQRGRPQSYDNVGTEAGFEDLFDMQGEALTMVRHRGQLMIFGNQEIWRARPRRDTFAFDFVADIRNIGAPLPRTAVSTPIGVLFLAQDLELYVLSGGQIQPLGTADEGGESRIQVRLQDELEEGRRAFALYDQTRRTYRLFYSDTAGSWPNRALIFDLGTGAFMIHDFSHELTHGFDFTDPGSVSGTATWDQQGTTTWDDIATEWDNFGFTEAPVQQRDVLAFSSAGTAYRFRSDQTTDDGTEIDARWRSHGLKINDNARFNYLDALEIDFESDSASSLTVAVSDDGFVNDLDEIELSIASSNQSVAYAPVRVTARAPQFELRTDGSGPQINRMWASVRRGGRF